jgi:glutaredoxin-like protein
MALFDDSIRQQLTTILAEMQDEVTLVFFSQEMECQSCQDAHLFVEEITSLNPKLKMIRYNLVADQAQAAAYQVERVPAIILLDKDGINTQVRFFGIPAGYEINSFLGAILEVSGKRPALPPELASRIAKIDKDVHIQVFVTMSCPHCPEAVMTAHRLALENRKVLADMVEANTFTPMSIHYHVEGVPKIVINETHELLGAQPITAFLDLIEKL